jgi:tetratricopeptide (TPR) repeat protein
LAVLKMVAKPKGFVCSSINKLVVTRIRTYAYHLYFGYQDYERVGVQLAIARGGLPNNYEAIALQAYIDRRQGNLEKAIHEFNEAITLDALNPAPISDLAYTLYAASQGYGAHRLPTADPSSAKR